MTDLLDPPSTWVLKVWDLNLVSFIGDVTCGLSYFANKVRIVDREIVFCAVYSIKNAEDVQKICTV